MTVGVGALSADTDGRETRAVVVCSDRMVTWGNTEFEHDIPKIIPITDRIAALMAGDAIRGSRIVRESTNQVLAGSPSVLSVVQAAAHQYSALRRDQLQTEFFAPRGIAMQQFYQGLQNQMVGKLALDLDGVVARFNYGVELLIAGVDDAGAHLYFVGNPGHSNSDFEQIGFCAIGSGAIHAQQSMIGLGHTRERGLEETIFNVYASKRRAEAAPGVGHYTDIAVIRDSGITYLTHDQLARVGELYADMYRPITDTLRRRLVGMQLLESGTSDLAQIE